MSDAGKVPTTNVDLFGPAPSDADITLGPATVDGDVGFYPSAVLALAEALAEQGVTVRLAHDAAHISVVDQRGPVEDMVIEAAIGLAGGGALQAVKYVFTRLRDRAGHSREVHVELTVGTGPEASHLHITGTAQDVADAAARLIEKSNHEDG